MNRAYTSATAETRPSPAYHPPFPLNTSAHRTNKVNPHHHYAPSIASPLTPSSTTATNAPLTNRASWTRSRAATTNNTHQSVILPTPASYKDDFLCYTPTSPLPTFPPPPPLLVDNSYDRSSSGNTNVKTIKIKTPASSNRSRTRTSGASSLYSPLPYSSLTPISSVAYTTVNNTEISTPVIDSTSSGFEKLNFHDGQHQPDRDHRSETAVGGVASHRYASILPSPRCSRIQSTSFSQKQQLSSPLPSPVDSNTDSSVVPPPPPQPTPYQREDVRNPTASTSFTSYHLLGLTSSNSNSNNSNVESSGSSNIEKATGGSRTRTISPHYNFLQGQGQSPATASMLSDFPLPPTAATGTTPTMGVDGRVMPWLQEAMQTVTMLESRLQELEEDCKASQGIQGLDAIVQQDQGWMDYMEMAVRWTTYVLENALISSATSCSSDGHQSAGSKSDDGLREGMRTRTRTCSHGGLSPGDTNDGENGGVEEGGMMPGQERNTHSEEILPSLVAISDSERSSSCLGLQSSARFESGAGAKTGTRTGWRLMELSKIDPSLLNITTTTAITTTGTTTTADGADTARPSSTSSSVLSSSTLQANKDDVLVDKGSPQEALYRNAIMVALRHLKTIDIALSISFASSSSKASTVRESTFSRRHGNSQNKEDVRDTVKQATRGRRRMKVGAPDNALKDWLDNSSMMSLISNITTEDLHDDEGESNDGEGSRIEEELSVSRVLATFEDMNSNTTSDTELDLQAAMVATPELRPPSSPSSAQMRHRRHLLVGSLNPLQETPNPTSNLLNTTTISPIPNTHSKLLSANTSTETLSHALSTLSLHATISGSSQSLQTNLGNTLLDERVFLKQHILHLDRLRVQEQTRHGRMEDGYRQLAQDLGRFSKELLGSVNELTCAQAALDDASELALLALSSIEKDTNGSSVCGSSVIGRLAGSQQQQQGNASEGVPTTTSIGTTTDNKNTMVRQKRLIAASRKELESSGRLAGECIKRIRRLAADCVGITELAAQGYHSQHQQQMSNTAGIIAPVIRPAATAVGGEGGAARLQRYAFAAMVEPLELEAIPTTVESSAYTGNTNKEDGPNSGTTTASTLTASTSTVVESAPVRSGSKVTKESTVVPPSSTLTIASNSAASMFVDGNAFQEFEEHLVSIRPSPSTSNSATTESAILKRVFLYSSSARLNTNTVKNTKVNRRNNHEAKNTILSVFMKRVLTEDIYPCLLIHNSNGGSLISSTAVTKQSSKWMSTFLSSSSPTQSSSSLPPLSRGISSNNTNSVQGQWVQRLLKAMEANACEIEAWKPAIPNSTTTTTTTVTSVSTGSILVNNRTTVAPKTACCLCGTIRPCEFRLRLLDPTPSSTSSAYQQQQQQYHTLDRFCRERIVAVCDFYMFLGHLRQGLLDQLSSLELFRRALGLRQRMAYARIGSVDLVGGGGGGSEAPFSVTHE